ncbi:MAG: prepilin-type N-terminal cleavage/methylation domain-containing protein [Alphaproteobacteria bacterium]|nr:prepilin-type N-terminal cleavage/methylation domain-containing protein [Alphaproteobacteria bacterium]
MRKKMFLLDKRKTTNRFFGKQGGLSLIEMAIAIAVLGLLALPVLRAYRTNLMKASYENDLGALSTTLEGVNRYYISGHSSYPCPTDLSLKNGDTGFGVAGDCSDLNGIKLCTNTTWFEDDGICKTSTSSDATIIGGLPFADLKMSQENALDSWKNKLIYAVTHRQTDPTTYVNGNGSIQVMCVDDPKKIAAGTTGDNGAPDIVLSSGGSSIALYEIFVFSTGEDGIGGYNNSGRALSECGDTNERYEYENCNFDNIFFAREDPHDSDISAYSLSTSKDTDTGEDFEKYYFDDMTTQQSSPPANIWFQHEDNALYESASDINFVLTQATKVGIGTTDPGTPYDEVTLMIVGDVTAETATKPDGTTFGGKVQADSLCNEDGACFDPQIIAGEVDEMNCNADSLYDADSSNGVNRAVLRISDNSVGCNSGDGDALQVNNTIFGEKDCGTGYYATGIDSNGDLLCVAFSQ